MSRGAHTRKPVITPQQKRAIAIIQDNIVNGGTKTYVEMLIEAGYTPETARQQSNIMAGIRPHLAATIEWMEQHRTQVQERMTATIGKAEYKDLVRSLHTLTYNIQLLGGKPTQNLNLTSDDMSRINELIDD